MDTLGRTVDAASAEIRILAGGRDPQQTTNSAKRHEADPAARVGGKLSIEQPKVADHARTAGLQHEAIIFLAPIRAESVEVVGQRSQHRRRQDQREHRQQRRLRARQLRRQNRHSGDQEWNQDRFSLLAHLHPFGPPLLVLPHLAKNDFASASDVIAQHQLLWVGLEVRLTVQVGDFEMARVVAQ